LLADKADNSSCAAQMKIFGAAAGYLAAAGIYALNNI
jgi:hypothetical protein